MKLRLLPVVITVFISATVLFGGYYAYQSMAMENPLHDIVSSAAGVEQSQMDVSQSEVAISLKLRSDANLREIVHNIRTDGASIIGKRELKLKITNESSPKLDEWWSQELFDVAQAMETKQYAQIPKKLQEHADQTGSVSVSTEMDATNVYIRLTDGETSKFIILPRTAAKLGVWPNE